MNIINKIKAFFKLRGEAVELDLKAAEIKEGYAYLHLKEEEDVTYCVKGSDIGVTLKNKNGTLLERDFFLISNKKKKATENETTYLKEQPSSKEKDKTYNEKKDEMTPIINEEINLKDNKPQKEPKKQSSNITSNRNSAPFYERLKKKRFTIKVYPHEYELLVTAINTSGFSREDFILASVLRGNKRNVIAECKRLIKEHEELLKSLEESNDYNKTIDSK